MPVKNAVKQQKRWLQVANRDHFLLPREARAGAYIQAVVRALLVIEDCGARAHYDAILDILAPSEATEGIKALNHIPASQRQSYTYKKRVEVAVGAFAEAVLPDATEFAERYLLGNPAGACMVASFTTLDLMNIDPLDVESARESLDIWQFVYGKATTRQGRADHTDFRESLKAEGRRGFNDKKMMEAAEAWVKVHHVYHSLTGFLEEKYLLEDPAADDSPKRAVPLKFYDYDLGTMDYWSKRLRPFDEILGRERRIGRSHSV